MDAEQQVRHQGVVKRAPAIVVTQLGIDEAPAGATRERGALVGRRDFHAAAEERALGGVVGGALIWQHPGELGMDDGAVQTLGVVLKNELPIGVHVVRHAVPDDQR